MNFEFIVGTIIGVAGLFLTYACSKEQIKSYFNPNMKDLLSQLTDANISSKKQKDILRKINRKLFLFGKSMSSEYINSFSLKSKSKENILLNICFGNHIELTSDICKSFLGYDSLKLRELTFSNFITEKAKGKRRSIVYISALLKEKFPNAATELLAVLKKHNITVKELSHTKDIWCRDYMPIQNRMGELIQFNYAPSYLKGKKEWEDSRSNVHEVCKSNGFKPIYSDIIIDGGNVVLYGDKAILTDRIFNENPEYAKKELIAEIEGLLKVKVLIIPSYDTSTDITGHADGMVRFVNEKVILGNDREKDYKYIRDGINQMCAKNDLEYIDIPFFEQKSDKKHELSAIGIYVNYLEVDNLIVLPKFGVEGNKDKEVENLFREIFPDKIIETIDYNEVALEGGLMNCTTWTITE